MAPAAKPIYVTQPDLPPLEEFLPYLEQIWDSKMLTNGGPFHAHLEQALCEHLGVPHLALVTNGTHRPGNRAAGAANNRRGDHHALLIRRDGSLAAVERHHAGIRGHRPATLNIDPARIEAAITPSTTAILAVHCYGHPCDVKAIQGIADHYNLKVIYDAAHAFGVAQPATVACCVTATCRC